MPVHAGVSEVALGGVEPVLDDLVDESGVEVRFLQFRWPERCLNGCDSRVEAVASSQHVESDWNHLG